MNNSEIAELEDVTQNTKFRMFYKIWDKKGKSYGYVKEKDFKNLREAVTWSKAHRDYLITNTIKV